jgi:phosphoserine phosphatase
MIVPRKDAASPSASVDFPLAVGPATINACGNMGRIIDDRLTGNQHTIRYRTYLFVHYVPWGHAKPLLAPAYSACQLARAMSLILTIVAQREATSLTPARLNHIRNAVRGSPPIVLSEGEAADIPVANPPEPHILAEAIEGAPIDAILTKPRGRRKAVLIADMDSTIVTGETLDELAAFAGVGEAIAAITRRAMNGELDFKAALRERVAMLKGLDVAALEKTWQRIQLTSGAQELLATMRARGAVTALVSGGFSFFTSRVAEALAFDLHRSNTLLDDGSVLTGTVGEPILDRDSKLAALHEVAAQRGVKLAATLAVGDGANDLDMLRAAGLGVAFHAKPIAAREARARVDHADLRALLFAQGYASSMFAG